MNSKSRTMAGMGVALLLAVVASGGGALAASADPVGGSSISPDLAAEFDARADLLGISEEVKDSLILKFLSGEVLDSASGAAPVSSSTYISGGAEVTRDVFADGSVSINSSEIPQRVPAGGIGLFSVTGCYDYSGVGWNRFENCLIETQQFLYSQSFRMNGYRGTGGTYYGIIDSVYDLDYVAIGVAVTSTSLTIIKSHQNASGPAKATATVYWSTIGGSGQNRVSGYVNYSSIYDTAP